MRSKLTFFFLVFFSITSFCQEALELGKFATFSTTRNINGHSVELLEAKSLDIRITHRFGDIGGDLGGIHSLWGLDFSSDIRIALEYGINDDFMIGLGRSKGGSSWREVYDGFFKYQVNEQTKEIPIGLSILSSVAYTSMRSSNDETTITNFASSAHRFRYYNSMIVSSKITNSLSLQSTIGWSHRNYVAFDDDNDVVNLAFSSRYKINHKIALAAEYFYALNSNRMSNEKKINNSLSFGLAFDTGGHVFQIDLTNARGIGENQFVPLTFAKWDKGEYRLGFTISRPINL